MECQFCHNEVPDESLECMFCGRTVQTEQERDARIRKKVEAEKLEAERLKAEQLKKEQQEREQQKKEQKEKLRREKLKQQQQNNSTSSSVQGKASTKTDPADKKKNKAVLILTILLVCIFLWLQSSVFKKNDSDTNSGQPQNTVVEEPVAEENNATETQPAEAEEEPTDAAPAESGQLSDDNTGSASNETGTVSGKIVDQDTGAAIEGARVVLTNEEGKIFPQNEVLKSDNTGSFSTSVPGGVYTIKITKTNYVEVTFGYATVTPNETIALGNLGIEKDSTAETAQDDTQTAADEYYIIPYSNTRYLTDSDLDHLSEWDLKLARNEIYARHGRRFKDPDLQNYFDKQSWYNGIYDPDDFDKNHASELTALEKKNAEFILAYEIKHGYFT